MHVTLPADRNFALIDQLDLEFSAGLDNDWQKPVQANQLFWMRLMLLLGQS